MRHPVSAMVLLIALSMSACGGDGAEDIDTAATEAAPSSASASPSPGDDPESSDEDEDTDGEAGEPAVVVRVRIADGSVDPAGDRVAARAGEPIRFVIDSDAPAEMHVHSTPEHHLDIQPGTTKKSITIDRPGVVEVELHHPDVVVVQLEVR